VDMELYNKRLDTVTQVGEEGFAEAWQDEVDENQCEYMDTYFRDLYELEIYETRNPWGLFVATGEVTTYPERPDWSAVNHGIHVCLNGQTLELYWLKGAVLAIKLERDYTLVYYPDLPFDMQAAVTEALEEVEQHDK